MKKKCDELTLVFELRALTGASALAILIDTAGRLGKSLQIEFDTTSLSAIEFLAQVKKTGKWSHEIKLDDLMLGFGVVTSWKYCFINIAQLETENPVDWSAWATPFLKNPGFVQAWVADREFDYWQNAEQPAQYDLAGRDYSDLPLVSNKLPPPLKSIWIDTSNNPGRRALKNGYVEAVGKKMWLSPTFKDYIGGIDFERLRAAGWDIKEEGSTEIIILTAPSGSFSEEAMVDDQRKLRSALYG